MGREEKASSISGPAQIEFNGPTLITIPCKQDGPDQQRINNCDNHARFQSVINEYYFITYMNKEEIEIDPYNISGV